MYYGVGRRRSYVQIMLSLSRKKHAATSANRGPRKYTSKKKEREDRGLIFFDDKPSCGFSNYGKPLNLDECVLVLVRNNETIYRKVGFKILDYKGNVVKFVSTRDRENFDVYNLPIYIENGDYFTFDEQEPIAIYYGDKLKKKFFNKL